MKHWTYQKQQSYALKLHEQLENYTRVSSTQTGFLNPTYINKSPSWINKWNSMQEKMPVGSKRYTTTDTETQRGGSPELNSKI
jgi:hypothetical protein